MAALHNALKSLGPLDIADAPLDDLKPFLSDAFSKGQLLVDSVPIAVASEEIISSEGRSRASSSASSASEISLSHARSDPPPSDVEALQKEWKQVKLNPKENPLGMSVYKLGGKDGKGSWFARRSVHEGLGFTKWKKGLEREFPETMKVAGGPGEGNIRGIGGERRMEYRFVDGVGKVEVYLLSAQFPGPTTPRDFVTMVITSDQALSDQSESGKDVPRHFMVISRPCTHPDAPPREGFIRGQYESVEFIREIPIYKAPRKSSSTTNLPATRSRAASTLSKDAILRNAKKSHPFSTSETGHTATGNLGLFDEEQPRVGGRARGKTISFDISRGSDAKGEHVDVPRDDDESECNPIEWIMITRSDPGGSVPRFLIDRGTPGGIVSDASKFLDWACGKDISELESDDESQLDDGPDTGGQADHHRSNDYIQKRDLHTFQTNGHLAGIEEITTPTTEIPAQVTNHLDQVTGGLYGLVSGVAGAAGGFVAAHTPTVVSHNFSRTEETKAGSPCRDSVSSISSVSSAGSFTSALENYGESGNDASSTITIESGAQRRTTALQDRELQKLEERKRKLDEKLNKTREKELNKKSEDSVKEEEAIRKAEDRHEREKRKQEERYRREVERLEKKKEKEEKKAEERRKKALEKDEKSRLLRDLEEARAELSILRKEKEILRSQVGDLQAENTALAAKVGRLGPQGEEVLRDVRAEVGRTGRLRASSLKGIARAPSYRSSSGGEKAAENRAPVVPAKS
ncbi:hypothetical protein ONS95_014837 [Cadophora gregata]|uniref:uncharacterized protein n=1 Tax=Cadophora gregata TaxID=51156 RepID=UPI0026DC7150|nr:uncharacterized protein ONS95_014837 [Cadophora gregata]KAK0113137.1 hypothetical protein ONS95_014837 [Cadophora gregata]KAK0125178.1 hypothetical protein ONS96_009038 [Cadophora gregata f. sp. sojae]